MLLPILQLIPPREPAIGGRILVVEDNITNQLVALYNKADAAALTKWKLIKV